MGFDALDAVVALLQELGIAYRVGYAPTHKPVRVFRWLSEKEALTIWAYGPNHPLAATVIVAKGPGDAGTPVDLHDPEQFGLMSKMILEEVKGVNKQS